MFEVESLICRVLAVYLSRIHIKCSPNILDKWDLEDREEWKKRVIIKIKSVTH